MASAASEAEQPGNPAPVDPVVMEVRPVDRERLPIGGVVIAVSVPVAMGVAPVARRGFGSAAGVAAGSAVFGTIEGRGTLGGGVSGLGVAVRQPAVSVRGRLRRSREASGPATSNAATARPVKCVFIADILRRWNVLIPGHAEARSLGISSIPRPIDGGLRISFRGSDGIRGRRLPAPWPALLPPPAPPDRSRVRRFLAEATRVVSLCALCTLRRVAAVVGAVAGRIDRNAGRRAAAVLHVNGDAFESCRCRRGPRR